MTSNNTQKRFLDLNAEVLRPINMRDPLYRKNVEDQEVRTCVEWLETRYPMLAETLTLIKDNSVALKRTKWLHDSSRTLMVLKIGDYNLRFAAGPSGLSNYDTQWAAITRPSLNPLKPFHVINSCDNFGVVDLGGYHAFDRQAAGRLLAFAYDKKWIPVPQTSQPSGARSALVNATIGPVG